MGYYLHAIIGSQASLTPHASDYPAAVVAPLDCSLALIPITEELLAQVGASGPSGRFERFTPALEQWLRIISASEPTAYIEAEFFGGTGSQSAVVWSRHAQLLPPTHGSDAINKALQHLGISRRLLHDEFEVVGLQRHRDTSDWLEDEIPNDRNA